MDWQDHTVACAAAENVLPGESPDAYQELWKKWFYEYEPETGAELDILADLVNAAWRLRRARQAFMDVEQALISQFRNAAEWPRAQAMNLSRQQHYYAGAESSFHKNLRVVEFMRERSDRMKARAEKWQKENPKLAGAVKEADADAVLKSGGKPSAKKETKEPVVPQTRAQQMFTGQSNTKKRKKIVRLDQWAEVRIVNGKTVTELYPSNAKLIERGKGMLPAPEFVYRRLNFPDGIPPEYNWVGIEDDQHRQRGGMGIQRMTIDTWLDLVESEAKRDDGHLSPTPNLPRPEEHGGCDCAVCNTNRDLLEQMQGPDRAA